MLYFLLFYGCFQFSVCEWFIKMVALLLSFSFCFSLVYFCYGGLSIYLHCELQRCLRSCQMRWLYFLLFPVVVFFLVCSFLSLPFVGVLEFSDFTNLFYVSFLAFLKTLCLMALLRWNDLSWLCMLGFCNVFYILCSYCSLFPFTFFVLPCFWWSFLFLGMVFSAACNMVLTKQLCASLIVFWSRTLVVILLFVISSNLLFLCSISDFVSWRRLFHLLW